MTYICDNCEKYPCTDDDYKMRFTCPGFSEKPKPTTNADKIRAMSDEELAVFLSETTSNAIVVLGIGSNGKSKNAFDWYEWLKEEVSE